MASKSSGQTNKAKQKNNSKKKEQSSHPKRGKQDEDDDDIFNLLPSSENDTRQAEKILPYRTWDQDDNTVSITFFVGKKLSANEISVEFGTDTCLLKLSDQRKFECRLNQPIIKEHSRAQVSKLTVILKMKKQEPGVKWAKLEFDPYSFLETKSKPKMNGNPKNSKSNGITSSGSSASKETVSDETDSRKEINEINATKEAPEQKAKEPPEQKASESQPETVPEPSSEEPESVPTAIDEGPLYKLEHIKNSWFENINLQTQKHETMVVSVFVKNIVSDTIQVDFKEESFTVKFQTKDPKFLVLHDGTTDETMFLWEVKTVDKLETSQCRYKVKQAQVELRLMKKVPRKWGALEPLSKGAPSKKQSQPTDQWLSASTNTPVSSATKVSATTTSSADTLESKPSTSKGLTETTTTASKEGNQQKPTCMVSPLAVNRDKIVPVVTPGSTGLDNLGNTCFMNSVLQVLANTIELRDYFLGNQFQKEINHDNPLGTGGQLAVAFATVVKILWSGQKHSYAPSKLKSLVASRNSRFAGFAQHDAQDFMEYLVDCLHEDINRIKKKPYIEKKESDNRADEDVANESWKLHLMRDNSFIVDLFAGQYKSTLICPVCDKVSITFDPFSILPVPIPKRQRDVPVIFISVHSYNKPVKYNLRVPTDSTVEHIKEALYQKTNVHPGNLRVFEASKGKMGLYQKHAHVSPPYSDRINIVACEVLSEELTGEKVCEIMVVQRTVCPVNLPSHCSACMRECGDDTKLKRCTKCLRAGYCDQNCQKQNWPRHKGSCKNYNDTVGTPFIISLPASQVTYTRLYQMVDKIARYSVDIFQPPQDELERSPSVESDPQVLTPKTLSASSTATSCSTLTDEQPQITEVDRDDSDTGLVMRSSSSDPMVTSVESTSTTSSQPDTGVDTLSTSSTSLSADDSDFASGRKNSNDVNMLDDDGATEPLLGDASTQNDALNCENNDDKLRNEQEMKETPVRAVMGRPKDFENPSKLFHLQPLGQDLQNLPGHKRLVDNGEEPLDLEDVTILGMDWRNSEKSRPYVFVQSKPLEFEENLNSISDDGDGNEISLKKCLSLFTEPEILSPEHAWYCPKCKAHREASKQLSIWRLPNTLIIQLKRFSFRNFLWRDKIDKFIDFPTRELDLSPYFVGKVPANEPPPIYDLYGVVNHYGGIMGGHYTAFVRCPDPKDYRTNTVGWRLCDDSMVSQAKESQVVTRAAYLLFYRRRNMTVTLPPTLSNPQAEEDAPIDQSEPNEDDSVDQSPQTARASAFGNRSLSIETQFDDADEDDLSGVGVRNTGLGLDDFGGLGSRTGTMGLDDFGELNTRSEGYDYSRVDGNTNSPGDMGSDDFDNERDRTAGSMEVEDNSESETPILLNNEYASGDNMYTPSPYSYTDMDAVD